MWGEISCVVASGQTLDALAVGKLSATRLSLDELPQVVDVATIGVERVVDERLAQHGLNNEAGVAGIVVLVYDVAVDGVSHVVDIPLRVGYSFFHFHS